MNQEQPEAQNPCAACGRELDQPMTCQRCRDHLRAQLLELPTLYVYAAMSLRPDTTGGGGRGGTKVHAPIPLRLDVLSLLGPAARGRVSGGDQEGSTPVLATLQEWADLIAQESRHAPVRPHLNTLTDFLVDHHAFACRQPFAADYVREVAQLHSKLRGIAQIEVRQQQLNVPCPRCEMYTLVREDWSGYAGECRACGVLLTETEYQDLVKATVAQHEEQEEAQESVAAEAVTPQVCAA